MRTRQEELAETPLVEARPENWPNGVRPIAINEMQALGIDAAGNLYWHGKSVAIRKIQLRPIELIIAGLATAATLIQALVALVPALPRWLGTN
jgi:hypothetical protein